MFEQLAKLLQEMQDEIDDLRDDLDDAEEMIVTLSGKVEKLESDARFERENRS